MEASAEPRQLPAGTMLDDKYRIESLIAVGGMGAVYLGTHTRLRKRVAIKVLNPNLSSKPMIERFHREATIASQIGHEGIAQVTDIGTSLDGEPFLVMEYLEGESLAGRLRQTGALPVESACELGSSILSPLAAAHAAGIVHRDLKPDNVFLVRQSRGELVKLLDFGISRAAGLEQEFRLTTTGLILGTPYYMSPEQARGDSQVGPGADLYALGVILYEMLVGRVPIHAENYNQLMYRVMIGDFERPRQARPDIPDELEQIILRAMATTPEQRPQTAGELEAMLLPFCRPAFREAQSERVSGARISFATPVPATRTAQQAMAAMRTPPPGTEQTVLAAPTVPLRPEKKKSRLPLIIAAVIVVVGGGAAAFVAMNQKDGPKPPPVVVTAPVVTPPPVAPPPPKLPEVAPAPANVTLRFSVDASGAVISIDGKPLDGTELTAPKDDAVHALHITAPDRAPYDREIHFDESQRFDVALKKVARPTGGKRDPHKGSDERIDSQSPYQ